MMKEAEVKEKQSKKEIFELIGALDDKLLNIDAKVTKVDFRIDTLKVSSNKRIDILEEKVNGIDQRCLAIRNKVLGSGPPKSFANEKYDGSARHRNLESRKTESKSRSRHRDKSSKSLEREKKREHKRDRKRDRKRERESRRKIARESGESRERILDNRKKHESREKNLDSRREPDSSCPVDNSRSRRLQPETTRDNDSYRREPRVIAEQGGLLPLTEIQLQAFAKPDNCVKFIGKLVIASFPEGYFLKKENTFATAITSHQMDDLYRIVSMKYKEIIRRGHPSKILTKKEMSEVIRNRVFSYRALNRHLMK